MQFAPTSFLCENHLPPLCDKKKPHLSANAIRPYFFPLWKPTPFLCDKKNPHLSANAIRPYFFPLWKKPPTLCDKKNLTYRRMQFAPASFLCEKNLLPSVITH